MTALICCLFICVVYVVMFSIKMTCTNVSCCWVCVLISLLTLLFMSLAVLVSRLKASPKKGKRLLLVHLLKGDIPLKEGFLFRSCVTVSIRGLYDV